MQIKWVVQEMTINTKSEITTTIALVGLMGAGKSAIGRRLAARLSLPFFDSDTEIESEVGMTISEFFKREGEVAFRSKELSVIKGLLSDPVHILATGGGSFVEPQTRRELMGRARTVWLKADLEVLHERVLRKNHRPLLQTGSPRNVLSQLIKQRYPIYKLADIVVESDDGPHNLLVDKILNELGLLQAEHKNNPDQAKTEVLF